MLKAIFFDLDGTLLPLDEDKFIKLYFSLLCKKLVPYGYDPDSLIDTIWKGTEAMLTNDGLSTNEEVFWKYFALRFGEEKLKDKDLIDSFYTKEFKETKNVCSDNDEAVKIVEFCKEKNLKVILSTNPIFPKIATITRMGYVGLKEEDFDFITTYENSCFCKPNPKYFEFLLNKFDLKTEEVLVFGNNTYEDGDCANSCNLKCYMVGNYIINSSKAKNKFERIEMKDVIKVIEKYI